jgi:hypothetical protein
MAVFHIGGKCAVATFRTAKDEPHQTTRKASTAQSIASPRFMTRA